LRAFARKNKGDKYCLSSRLTNFDNLVKKEEFYEIATCAKKQPAYLNNLLCDFAPLREKIREISIV
jgi:hypothetical protein